MTVHSDRMLQILFEVTSGILQKDDDTPEEVKVRRALAAEVRYANRKGWIIDTPSSP